MIQPQRHAEIVPILYPSQNLYPKSTPIGFLFIMFQIQLTKIERKSFWSLEIGNEKG